MKYFKTDYELDSAEVGKIVTIFSAAALVFSIHGYYMMEDVETRIADSENRLEEGLGFVQSDDSQRLIDALQDIRGVTQEFNVLQEGFQSAEQSLNSTREAGRTVETTQKQYQWLVVLSISGIIAGLTIIVIDVE